MDADDCEFFWDDFEDYKADREFDEFRDNCSVYGLDWHVSTRADLRRVMEVA